MKANGFIAAFLAIASVGCAQTVKVADTIRLKEDEGVIVYHMACGQGVAWAEFYASGTNPSGYLSRFAAGDSGVLVCPPGFQTQRVKAGRYFVGKVGYETWVTFKEPEAMQFEVLPEKLNYIGYIHNPSRYGEGRRSRVVLIGDPYLSNESEEARRWLAENHRALLDKYEFVPSLAVGFVRH